MAVLTSTMSASSTPQPKPAGSGFPRKVILLVLLEIDSAVGFFMLVRKSTALPLLGANLLAIMLLGMAAGFGTRIVLHRRNWFVRFVSGTAALIIGLFVLGALTRWLIGLGPLVFWRTTIDWIGLGKLMLGITSFLLSMQAWWKPAQAGPVQISPASATIQPVSVPVKAPNSQSHSKVRAKRRPAKQAHFPVFSSNPKTRGAGGKPAAAKRSEKATATGQKLSKPVTRPRRSLFRHKPEVHLSKIERHLCPYCLEPVTRNDSRGVVECDICHTLHHGDCWAIAGSCQVPHYTAA